MKTLSKTLKAVIVTAFVAFLATSCSRTPVTDEVNVFVGTGGHGHTFPGATLPFGMMQLGPDTRVKGWDGCGGYHYSDDFLYGFSHTHLSGTGIADYSDILILPMSGNDMEVKTDSTGRYGSSFSHEEEYAVPGYYKVELQDYAVTCEMTTALRSGMHRYIFLNAAESRIYLDLTYRDIVLESGLKQVSDTEFTGYRFSSGWAKNQKLFFDLKFNRPVTKVVFLGADSVPEKSGFTKGTDIRVLFYFDMKDGDELLVKTGISGVDMQGAANNLNSEIPGWDFLGLRDKAEEIWNRELSKIEVETNDPEQRSLFYTALYHSFIAPNIYSDVDGRYRGRDMKIHKADFDYYTVFSLWDTYRAEHPLLTIIDRKRTVDFIRTFIRQWEEGGLLPVWELSANETNCMIGNHAIPVIADAIEAGLTGFDREKAFEAMKTSMEQKTDALTFYRQRGYIPSDKISSSVSKTLELAFDDWCVAKTAKLLNKPEDYEKYIRRAQYYKNVFDEKTLKMRPRVNGGRKKPFDPKEADFNYTEANAWQYSFYVPQDVNGLISASGGDSAFVNNLDELFTTSSETSGLKIADMTGLIGQYAHGNEPSHHIAYLYSYAGAAWKTQKTVAQIRSEMYRDLPGGICGNEDCGQMSAWYVFSTIGFYPVQPASGVYVFGTPAFDKVTLNLENGKKFVAERNGSGIYIQSATLNGKEYTRSYITGDDIAKGGKLVFNMGDTPNKNYGAAPGDRPVSTIENTLLPTPFIVNNDMVFYDSLLIDFDSRAAGDIYYRLNSGDTVKFTKPFYIYKTTVIEWFLTDGQKTSMRDKAAFMKGRHGRSIKLNSKYAKLYTGGGDSALINFLRGSTNFADGRWQGYDSTDIDLEIDLGKVLTVNRIATGFLQDENSWIFMPLYVEYRVSADGVHFSKPYRVENDVDPHASGTIIKDFGVELNGKKARYIKVYAKSRGKCPPWHKGAAYNGTAWLFADEVVINGD